MIRAVTGKEPLMEHKTLQGGPGRLPAGSGVEAETRRRVAGQGTREVMVKKARRSSWQCDCAYQGMAGISGPDLKGFAVLAEAFDVLLWQGR